MGETVLGVAGDLLTVVTDAIGIFTEPPLQWFVVLGLLAGSIGIVKRLIPRKRAR